VPPVALAERRGARAAVTAVPLPQPSSKKADSPKAIS
jgi:hypothetical protein